MAERGVLSFKLGEQFYTLFLEDRGWLAVDLLAFLEDILDAISPERQILKLLGFTIEIRSDKPAIRGDHWIVVDLAQKLIETQSPLLVKVIDREPLGDDTPLPATSAKRIYAALDRHDFTVKVYK